MLTEREYDVVIVGGGTAGLIAAIACARLGVHTVLVERKDYLGGLACVGMTLGGFRDGAGAQVVGGIPAELAERVLAVGGGLGYFEAKTEDSWIGSLLSLDPEWVKHIAFEMVCEAGCKLLLGTVFSDVFTEGRRIKGIEAVYAGQKIRLYGKTFIDATGNADMATAAGAEIMVGDENGEHQALTCIFRLGNVGIAEFVEYMNGVINTDHKEPWSISDAPTRASWSYWLPWRDAAGIDLPKTCGIYFHGNSGDIFINSAHIELDPLEPESFSMAAVGLRRQVMKITSFLKERVPGFERAYLSNVYEVGIRESRRVIGDYVLTAEDLRSGHHFEDVVAKGAYPVDVHKKHGHVAISRADNIAYEIPYRVLLVKDFENLLVAGRCMSATFMAAAGLRGMGPCMSSGQAVGTAAGLAARQNITPRALNIAVLQQQLRKDRTII